MAENLLMWKANCSYTHGFSTVCEVGASSHMLFKGLTVMENSEG